MRVNATSSLLIVAAVASVPIMLGLITTEAAAQFNIDGIIRGAI